MSVADQIPIYYINLEARQDRRRFMEDQFATLGLRAQRIDAVTPAQIPAELARKFTNPARYRWLTLGELACSLSHLKVMEALLAGPASHALILEDDAVLSGYLPRFLNAFAAAPPPFDIVRVETYDDWLRIHPKADRTVGEIELRRVYTSPCGTAGYVIARQGAENVMLNHDVFRAQIDMTLFHPFARLAKRLSIRHADPGLCIQLHKRHRDHSLGLTDLDHHRAQRDSIEAPYWRLHFDIFAWLDKYFHVGVVNRWRELADGVRRRSIPFRPE